MTTQRRTNYSFQSYGSVIGQTQLSLLDILFIIPHLPPSKRYTHKTDQVWKNKLRGISCIRQNHSFLVTNFNLLYISRAYLWLMLFFIFSISWGLHKIYKDLHLFVNYMYSTIKPNKIWDSWAIVFAFASKCMYTFENFYMRHN